MPEKSQSSLDQLGTENNIDKLSIATIRTLAMDAIEEAKSGHPGTPMGMAPVVYTLWQRFLRIDPANPIWPNRDRFVLSAGHASMLFCSMLFLTGVKSIDPDYEMPPKVMARVAVEQPRTRRTAT